MNNTANKAHAIIGIVSVIILWTYNNRRHNKEIQRKETECKMPIRDSIIGKDTTTLWQIHQK